MLSKLVKVVPELSLSKKKSAGEGTASLPSCYAEVRGNTKPSEKTENNDIPKSIPFQKTELKQKPEGSIIQFGKLLKLSIVKMLKLYEPFKEEDRIKRENKAKEALTKVNKKLKKDGSYHERGAQSKNWCFTNFDFHDCDWYLKDKLLDFVGIGDEICPDTGRPHHQGFLQLKKKQSLGWLKNHLSKRCKFKMIRGTYQDNVKYCSEDGSYICWGLYSEQGERNDIYTTSKKIIDGTFNKCDVTDNAMWIKYNGGINQSLEFHKRRRTRELRKAAFLDKHIELRPQQNYWLNCACSQKDDMILWICDYDGQLGKSYFQKYMKNMLNSCTIKNGATKDIALIYKEEKYVCVNLTRTGEEKTNYSIYEDLRDGEIQSPKWDSYCYEFEPPVVMIFANFFPDIKALSIHRWHILSYRNGVLLREQISKHVQFFSKEIPKVYPDVPEEVIKDALPDIDIIDENTCSLRDLRDEDLIHYPKSIVCNYDEDSIYYESDNDDIASLYYESDDCIDGKH